MKTDVLDVLGRVGNLEVRLAGSRQEITAAQRLRYDVFYREMGAQPDPESAKAELDTDIFDDFCDHLLVIEKADDGTDKIVGTYRLMLESHMRAVGRFYSDSEFNLSPLRAANKNKRFLELGRSCVLPEYRSKRTMELLWHGTWTYALRHGVDIMFGCASFHGTDPADFADSLGWLNSHACLDAMEDCKACRQDSIDLATLKVLESDSRRALAKMPPLLKGYLRLGRKGCLPRLHRPAIRNNRCAGRVESRRYQPALSGPLWRRGVALCRLKAPLSTIEERIIAPV